MSILFAQNYRLLNKQYENPRGLNDLYLYSREIFKMDNFRLGIKNRLQYALMIGGIDISSRLAFYRYLTGGLYSSFGTVDVQAWRKFMPTCLAAACTCWISVPFEVARKAYYADRTFPADLQKGYTSIFAALRRIPFEEGPYYFFRNSFPIMVKNYFQTSVLFLLFEFIQDKLSPIFRNGDCPRFPVKLL
jgi:solute carrier family 25 (mitochondrial oxoglutarate transporter), member 11